MRLRTRIALVFVLVALAGVTALALLDHHSTVARLREEQSARAEAIALAVATHRASGLHRRAEGNDGLRQLVEGMAQLYPDLALLRVIDAEGAELAGAHPAPDEPQAQRFRLDLARPEGGSLGAVEVAFTTGGLRKSLQRRMLNLAAIAAGLVLTLVGAAWLLALGITRPVETVATAMRRVQRGDLGVEVPVSGAGEVAQMGSAFNGMVESLRQGKQMRETFARYVSHQVAERIIGGEIPVRLTGEERHVAVLFIDLRGFTSLSENLSAPQIVELLNEYFELLVTVIFAHGGTIDKFIGDALMAVFGAPVPVDRPEAKAVRAAAGVLEAIAVLNARREARGQAPLKAGIGVHAGPVVAGNVGSPERMDYTVIGDTVNVTQRIESATKHFFRPGEASVVLVSGAVHEAAGHIADFEPLPPMELKGKSRPVALFRLVGLRAGVPSHPAPARAASS